MRHEFINGQYAFTDVGEEQQFEDLTFIVKGMTI